MRLCGCAGLQAKDGFDTVFFEIVSWPSAGTGPRETKTIRCPRCDKENPPGVEFCTSCRAPLRGVVSGAAEENLPAEEAPSGADDLREIRQVLVSLTDRVVALEQFQEALSLEVRGRRSPGLTPPPEPRPPPEPTASLPSTPAERWAAPGAPVERPAAQIPKGPSIDWEQVLGRNWFAILGAITLVLGAGFFLKLAIESDWIGKTGQIILGIATGVAFLAAGEYTQRRFPAWARAVTGGGIAILYLSIYAAFGFYRLIDPLPAFLFQALVVALSGLLALRYESLVIALMGIAGAFITPLLLPGGLPDRRLLLLYILLVDVGVLGVSTFRNWRWFTLLGLVGSYLLFGLYVGQISADERLLAQAGVTGVFLIFVGATTLFHILWRRIPGPPDMALIALNAIAYYGMTYGLLWDLYQIWFGLITLGLSLFYGLVGYGAIKRSGAPPQVALFVLATALVFLTLAVPLQLSGAWVTVAWAAEGAVLVWVGFVVVSWRMRAFALGVLGITAFRLLFFDTPVGLEGFIPLVNPRFPIFAVSIAAFYVGAYLYSREKGRLANWEINMSFVLGGAANLLTLFILSADIFTYFESQQRAALRVALLQESVDAQNNQLLSLTALWTIYAFALLAIGSAKGSSAMRWAGLGLLVFPVLKLILFDTFEVYRDPLTFRLVLNLYFLTFLLVAAVTIFAAYLYRLKREGVADKERYVLPALLVITNALTLWVLSWEAVHFFSSRGVALRADLASAMHLSLTVLWAVYAIGVIAAGIVRPARRIRLAGMGLLVVPVVKLFLFDVFLLEQGYRVAAFMILGGLLLVAGLAYNRYSSRIRGFLFEQAS